MPGTSRSRPTNARDTVSLGKRVRSQLCAHAGTSSWARSVRPVYRNSSGASFVTPSRGSRCDESAASLRLWDVSDERARHHCKGCGRGGDGAHRSAVQLIGGRADLQPNKGSALRAGVENRRAPSCMITRRLRSQFATPFRPRSGS